MPHHVLPVFAFFVLAAVLGGTSAQAASCNPTDRTQCCTIVQSQKQTNITRIQALDQSCTMSVVAQQSNRSFRRFGFGSDGQFSVFLQPGGNSQRASATQSFLIYPFGQNPTVESGSGNRFTVNSGSGQRWTFDALTSTPVSVNDCTLNVNPNFTLHNSGVSLSSCTGHIVIETPVEVGGEYIAYPDGHLTVHGLRGQTCQIANSDLYRYIQKGTSNTKDRAGRYYNIQLKYRSNREMAQALHRLCPQLDVSVLTTASNTSSAASSPAPRPRLQLNLDSLSDEPEPQPASDSSNSSGSQN